MADKPMTMLEKIAWACVEAYYATGVGVGSKSASWDSLRGFEKTVALAQARAAVETMRELDEATKSAGGEALYGHPYEKAVEWAKEEKFDNAAAIAEEAWRAIIDAILNEKG